MQAKNFDYSINLGQVHNDVKSIQMIDIHENKFDVKSIDITFLSLDITAKNCFKDLLIHYVDNQKPLSYKKFSSFVGISKGQWDNFRLKYKDVFQFET